MVWLFNLWVIAGVLWIIENRHKIPWDKWTDPGKGPSM